MPTGVYIRTEEANKKRSGINNHMYGKHHSEETRTKMSESRLKRKQRLGYLNSHETRKKIGEAKKGQVTWMRGKHHTEEAKNKLRENARINPNYGTRGKHRSEETRKKIGEANKGKPSWNKGKHFIPSEETRRKLKIARAKRVIPMRDTKIEVKIQNFLKQLGITFFTHQYIKEIEHGYQCDIFIPSLNMVIECDGDYWHKYPTGKEIDHIRTSELIQKGFKVLRLWEIEINKMGLDDFKIKLKDKGWIKT